jgi:hypothetical protein
MKKWFAGLAATIISGIVVYWFTVGIHSETHKESYPPPENGNVEQGTTVNSIQYVRQPEPLSDIIEDLRSTDVSVRISAAIKLESIGKGAAPAFPALVEALNHENLMFVEKVAEALLAIDEVAAKPHLVQLSDRLYQQRGGGVIDGSKPEDSLLGMLAIWGY